MGKGPALGAAVSDEVSKIATSARADGQMGRGTGGLPVICGTCTAMRHVVDLRLRCQVRLVDIDRRPGVVGDTIVNCVAPDIT